MLLRLLALLGACALAVVLRAAPGLATRSGGHAVSRAAPDLFLDAGEGFAPHSAADGIEWSGRISIPRAGIYEFSVSNGTLAIAGAGIGPGPVRLEAGSHPVRLRQLRAPGAIRAAVDWQGPGFPLEPVPMHYFAHEPADPGQTGGRALFEDLGCSNCHGSDSPSIQRVPAPDLTGIGGRIAASWIRRWLDGPERFREWASMPQLLAAGDRSDVAAFLASLGAPAVPEPDVRKSHEERGRTRFQSIGCVACHAAGLPLAGLGSKFTVGSLQRYLLDPLLFAPAARMPTFHLSDSEALDLAAFLVLSRNRSFEEPAAPGDPSRGRDLVSGSGCLACHRLDGLGDGAAAPGLESLDESGGCLADSVRPGLPRYRLTDQQRDRLRRFVRAYRAAPDTAPAPTFDLARRLRQLRCTACHSIDGSPPTGPLAESAPPLDGVGRKLRSAWIERAVRAGSRALDWQEMRMPGYGPSHGAWFADALPKASGVDPNEPEPAGPGGDPRAGMDVLGTDSAKGGMGCIGCHGWGDFPALGENGPNLREAGTRLRGAWFRRWMHGPERILPGTSMPNYFGGSRAAGSGGIVRDLWAALRAAPEMPVPHGFLVEGSPLGEEARPVPGERPIVIRWDMPEATPAAIAVGFPGGISYCFDAGESRLRYAWRGGFLDMSRTLLNKKSRATNLTETAELVGEIFYREESFPIRVGESRRIPQRKFRGYRLVDSVPEFHYEVDGASVRERIEATDRGIVRRFRISTVSQPMWFAPAEQESGQVRATLDRGAVPRGIDVEFEVAVATHP